jgi:hypothetical protein
MENYNHIVENADGKSYYLNGYLHRIDGPAREFKKYSEYYLYGRVKIEETYKATLNMHRAILNMIEMANPDIDRKLALDILYKLCHLL